MDIVRAKLTQEELHMNADKKLPKLSCFLNHCPRIPTATHERDNIKASTRERRAQEKNRRNFTWRFFFKSCEVEGCGRVSIALSLLKQPRSSSLQAGNGVRYFKMAPLLFPSELCYERKRGSWVFICSVPPVTLWPSGIKLRSLPMQHSLMQRLASTCGMRCDASHFWKMAFR